MKYNIPVPENSDFTIYNFPFGVAFIDGECHVVSRLGDVIIDIYALAESGLLGECDDELLDALNNDYLNDFIALGKPVTNGIRQSLIRLFAHGFETEGEELAGSLLYHADSVEMCLPVNPGDYTDFYSSKEHAYNVGVLFRGPENALQPNWVHLPVAYHGRSSSIVVSETDLRWPYGQILNRATGKPEYGPCQKMDYELEMAFIIGKESELGEPIPIEKAEEYIFGFALFNDWSARDIQSWEYVPLGPFLGKNFGSTISPWIVTIEALEPFRKASPMQDPEVLDYLKIDGNHSYDIALSVAIQTENGKETQIATSNYKYLYWNPCQQLAHHTVNGCNVRVGDILASGTISGPTHAEVGSLLEMTYNGKESITLADGEARTFLESGDTVVLRGRCADGHQSLGFGEATGRVLKE